MANKIFGVVDSENVLHEIDATTETGAKRYATKNGYSKIGFRHAMYGYALITHIKDNGVWRDYRAHHKVTYHENS